VEIYQTNILQNYKKETHIENINPNDKDVSKYKAALKDETSTQADEASQAEASSQYEVVSHEKFFSQDEAASQDDSALLN
jgi:hypothetical protein